MKCPLIKKVVFHELPTVNLVEGDCLQEECAWWESKIGKCSVRRIWIALQDIHEVLHDIAKALRVK